MSHCASGPAARDGRDVAINAVFYSLLLLFPGARLVYAFQYWREFSAPLQLLDPTRGGLALLGGFFGVVFGGALYLRRHRAEIGVFLDATVPALALGLFLGRIGCFLAGCNWGSRTGLPWGVSFLPRDTPTASNCSRAIGPDALLSLPVHPTQLYESLFGLLMLPSGSGWSGVSTAVGALNRFPAGLFSSQCPPTRPFASSSRSCGRTPAAFTLAP